MLPRQKLTLLTFTMLAVIVLSCLLFSLQLVRSCLYGQVTIIGEGPHIHTYAQHLSTSSCECVWRATFRMASAIVYYVIVGL